MADNGQSSVRSALGGVFIGALAIIVAQFVITHWFPRNRPDLLAIAESGPVHYRPALFGELEALETGITENLQSLERELMEAFDVDREALTERLRVHDIDDDLAKIIAGELELVLESSRPSAHTVLGELQWLQPHK